MPHIIVESVVGLGVQDRKSTRLNSSHGYISYAVFCLKKKKHRYSQRKALSMLTFFSNCRNPTTVHTGPRCDSHTFACSETQTIIDSPMLINRPYRLVT